MKALVFSEYGNPEEVLQVKEVDIPIPKENEVLIKIKSTAINDYDWSMVSGKPKVYQLLFGIFKPKHTTPGMELSGIIEEVGAKVSHFKIGDEVYGDISNFGFGTFAEYIAVNAKAVIHKPRQLSFEQAAALPHAALLAFQALENIRNNQKVLINGAGGGVGSIGFQIAQYHHCNITGVDSLDKFEAMRKLGFKLLIDYTETDFTKNGEQYDFILDCKSKKSAFTYLSSLKSNGTYITVGGDLSSLLSVFFWGKILRLFSSKKLNVLALQPNKGLSEVITLYPIKCPIDGPYHLEDIPRLIQYFGEGKHKGKIIINISSNEG